MIREVHFQNFKCLQNVTVKFGALSILVGANGSGKTSLLQGMDLLAHAAAPSDADMSTRQLRFGELFVGRRAPSRLVTGGRGGASEIHLDATLENKDRCHLAIALAELGASTENTYQLSVYGKDGHPVVEISGPMEAVAPRVELRGKSFQPRLLAFTKVVYLRPNPQAMCATSVSLEERPRLRADGAYLASVLAWMKGAREEQLERITYDLGKIVPGVTRIRTFREKVTQQDVETLNINEQEVFRPIEKTALGDRFEIEFENGNSIAADLLSEGTVLALGLLTKIHETDPEQSVTVLLDDIERGLHLEAQQRLMDVLRAVGSLHKRLQIICSTHSPYLLSLVQPKDVRVLALDGDGHTHVKRLDEHPDFEKWKFGTQTGELWAALGEGWVAKDPGAQSL